MEKPLRVIKYDLVNPESEFQKERPKNVIFVAEGGIRTCGVEERLVSDTFFSCSAVILRDICKEKFGLIHALGSGNFGLNPNVFPYEDYSKMLTDLSLMSCGEAILVEGDGCSPKVRILTELEEEFGINTVKTIYIERATIAKTKSAEGPFSISFRPYENEILIERVYEKDVSFYQGF